MGHQERQEGQALPAAPEDVVHGPQEEVEQESEQQQGAPCVKPHRVSADTAPHHAAMATRIWLGGPKQCLVAGPAPPRSARRVKGKQA